jgi:hypothetical protein
MIAHALARGKRSPELLANVIDTLEVVVKDMKDKYD